MNGLYRNHAFCATDLKNIPKTYSSTAHLVRQRIQYTTKFSYVSLHQSTPPRFCKTPIVHMTRARGPRGRRPVCGRLAPRHVSPAAAPRSRETSPPGRPWAAPDRPAAPSGTTWQPTFRRWEGTRWLEALSSRFPAAAPRWRLRGIRGHSQT